jgi:hypothetical protein
MQRTLADRLLQSAAVDFNSASELLRAHRFVLETLRSVQSALPPAVQATLNRLGDTPPRWGDSEEERVHLWQSINADSMGTTMAGAATRAALFVFPCDESSDDRANDVIWYFEMYYSRAGLPAEAFESAFHRFWSPMTPNKSLERPREG